MKLSLASVLTAGRAYRNKLSKFYQWLFTEKTTDINGSTVVNAGTGGVDADVTVKNTQVATLDGLTYINIGKKITGQTLIYFKWSGLGIGLNTGYYYYYNCGALSSIQKGFAVYYTNGAFQIAFSDGLTRNNFFKSGTYSYEDIKYIEILWSGITGETAYITINNDSYEFTNTLGWVGDSGRYGGIGDFNGTGVRAFIGNLYSSYIDGYYKYNFQEGQGVTILDSSGNGNHGTVINPTLSVLWGTKSDIAVPYALIKGYSKYLVNEVAGTTYTLADPEGSNWGIELRETGVLDAGSNPGTSSISFITDGINIVANSDNGSRGRPSIKFSGLTIGSFYKIVGIPTINSGSGVFNLYNGASYEAFEIPFAKIDIIVKCYGDNFFFNTDGSNYTFNVDWEFSIRELSTIPLLGSYISKLKPTISDLYYLDSDDITTGNGYMIRTTPTAITLFRVDVGSLIQLDTAAITYINYSDVTPEFTVSGITVDIAGVEVLSSTDTTYTTFKLLVVDNDAGDEISHISKDGVSYDVSNFNDGTGEYGVQTAINID